MPAFATLLLLQTVAQASLLDSLERDRIAGAQGRRTDAQLTRFAAYGFAGTVLVMRGGKIVLLKGYGFADIERGVPNAASTRFEMNSITKMFTGAAILQLASQGRVRLDDPVARFFDSFPVPKASATLRQLATHTSGLIVEGAKLAGDSRDAFVRDVARTPMESPPGERYRYTNAGFSLLAAVIETVTHGSFEEYLRRHLFAPAGMRTALFRNEVPSDDSRFAHGYSGTPAALHPEPPSPYTWGTVGAGGVWCTVGDIYRWLVALKERRVVDAAGWHELLTPPSPPALEAFGWHVDRSSDGRERIQKGGGSDDFASQFLYFPGDDVVIVWASNNLRQRWRHTLNTALPATILASTDATILPPVVPQPLTTLLALPGAYITGGDSLRLLTGPTYLYFAPNAVGVPTNVMFFPQDARHYTAFDPSNGAQLRLSFSEDAGQVRIALANHQDVTATAAR